MHPKYSYKNFFPNETISINKIHKKIRKMHYKKIVALLIINNIGFMLDIQNILRRYPGLMTPNANNTRKYEEI